MAQSTYSMELCYVLTDLFPDYFFFSQSLSESFKLFVSLHANYASIVKKKKYIPKNKRGKTTSQKERKKTTQQLISCQTWIPERQSSIFRYQSINSPRQAAHNPFGQASSVVNCWACLLLWWSVSVILGSLGPVLRRLPWLGSVLCNPVMITLLCHLSLLLARRRVV